MSEIGIATMATDKIVLAVISHVNDGSIKDAVALFADQLSFNDQGIRLEFNTKERLTEFFRKARELYPDMLLQINTIFVSGDRVLTEWTLQTTLIEPAFGNCRWKVPISLHGASIIRAQREDHRLGRLLRRAEIPAHRFGCAF